MRKLRKQEIEYAIGRLEALMQSRGVSQSDLAVLSSVEQGTISKILHSRQEPSVDVLQNLFGGLGLQLADVLSALEGSTKELRGYLATPLTGLSDEADTAIRDVVKRIR